MQANILSLYTPSTHSGVKIITIFFEGGHVEYQIKKKEVQNIMQVKYLTVCTPRTFVQISMC